MKAPKNISLPTLAPIEICSGCTACKAICPRDAIAMVADEEGFLRPQVDAIKCVGCHFCERACPALHPGESDPSPTCYAAYTKDENLRLKSSSGGIFTELARPIIESGGVVFGCAWKRPQLVAIHAKAETMDELAAMRGSKYVQSDLRETFREAKAALQAGRQVLFSGTPCQIAGLNAFLGKMYVNLLTVEVICHGAPSPKLFARYKGEVIKRAGRQSAPIDVSFREKGGGWRHRGITLLFADGTLHREPEERNGYLKAFLGRMMLRPSCYVCMATNGRSGADITLGDFWGIENVCPSMDDNRGITLILVHTKRGSSCMTETIARVALVEVPWQQAVAANPSYCAPRSMNPKRKRFMRLLTHSDVDCAYLKMFKYDHMHTFKNLGKGLIKRCLGIHRWRSRRRVGIVTVVESYLFTNYGSLMQHYALCKVLTRLGYGASRMVVRHWKDVCRDVFLTLKYRGGLILNRFGLIRVNPNVRKSAELVLYLNKKFRAFHRKHFNVTRNRTDCFTLYIAGSDQIWTNLTNRVLLSEVPSRAVRISYAASADWKICENSSEWRVKARQRLKDFDAISVREQAGVKLLSEIFPDRKIFHAIDPVMLLTGADYQTLAMSRAIFSRPTLFVYLLNIRTESDLQIEHYEVLARELGCELKILGIQEAERYIPEKYVLYLSPEAFLSAYRDARYIVTNSFHGTVFALLFEKSFLSIKQIDLPRANQNTRQKELLERFGLESRRIPADQLQIQGVALLNSAVDWGSVRDVMTTWRLASIDWLKRVLTKAVHQQQGEN